MSPRRLSREEQRGRTRERLVRAAAKVFARSGYEASVDAIAREAGFTKGAVYSNFEDKEELFLAVLEEHVEQRLRDVRDAFAGSASLADVRDGGRALAALIRDDRDVWLLFVEFWIHAARDRRLRSRCAELYERWREAIGEVIEDRLRAIRLPVDRDPRDLAATAIALVEGLMLQQLVDPDRITDELHGDALAALVGGFAVTGAGLDVDAFVGGDEVAS